MKRRLTYSTTVAFLILFSCKLSVFAQDNTFKPELSLGANAGLTLSTVGFSPKVYQESLRQFSAGITARYISEKNFGLQGELNISQRGWKEKKDSIPEHKFTKSLLYLELPVMTHIYFNLGSKARLVFNMGPQIGYQIKEEVLDHNIVFDPGFDPEGSIPSQYTNSTENKFDWGIVGGGGIEVRTGIGSFIIEGRYYYGLSDIYKNKKSDYYATSPNQVVNLKLTYLFRK